MVCCKEKLKNILLMFVTLDNQPLLKMVEILVNGVWEINNISTHSALKKDLQGQKTNSIKKSHEIFFFCLSYLTERILPEYPVCLRNIMLHCRTRTFK